jgi:Ca2+-binding RTX toxin-like protein
MRRAALLAVFGSVLLVAFAGVALAAVITCTGGRCEGTQESDEITGTDVRDRIFALGGFDFVDAGAGDDEINGQNGGDHIDGRTGNDTYNGGKGADLMHEFDSTDTGRDVFNGGPDPDLLEGGVQADILRGQDGDECTGPLNDAAMFGDEGNDDLFGGSGEDCMVGEEGTDEHYGGDNNDFINAVSQDTVGTQDLVDCGSGVDTAVVREPEDIVRANCENVTDVSTTRVADPGTTDEEQQLQREAFIQEHGLQPEGG